jgi:hypothetical protein
MKTLLKYLESINQRSQSPGSLYPPHPVSNNATSVEVWKILRGIALLKGKSLNQ